MPKAKHTAKERQIQTKRPDRILVLRNGKARMMDREEYERTKKT